MLETLTNWITWAWDYIVDSIYSGVVSMFATIPVPDFIANISTYSGAIGGQTAYYLGVLRFDEGLAIIISALVARRLIAMIPFIG